MKRFPLWIAAAGILAYHNSFAGLFLLDDKYLIVENPHIRRLWPVWEPMQGIRPVVTLTLALNYKLGQLNVWGYHVVNLGIHILTALAFFGLVRRTLETKRLRDRFGADAHWLAAAAAILWLVHPLHTQSVDYIIQRAELLGGLFSFLTLYCLVRGWPAGGLLCCALGMASKSTIVLIPLLTLLYDRIFLSQSLREIFRKRGVFYVGLAATWGMLAMILFPVLSVSRPSAGFHFKQISPMEYLYTQPGVILHYLRLSFWPHPLIFDYFWPIPRSAAEILPAAIGVFGIGLGTTLWALRRIPAAGFLGAWFFLMLAPTSSFIPVADPIFEYRMYLPLAALALAVVLAGYRIGLRRMPAVILTASLAVSLSIATLRRNKDYRSEITLWGETVKQMPNNVRARNNLGLALADADRLEEARLQFEQVLRLQPRYPEAHCNLGAVLAEQGKTEEAFNHYAQALKFQPQYADPHYNLGLLYAQQGQWEEALAHYAQALQIRPGYADAHNNSGMILVEANRLPEAIDQFREAVHLKPEFADAHYNLGLAFTRAGNTKEALFHFSQAVRFKPRDAAAHYHLGLALIQQGKRREAIRQFMESLRLQPGQAEVHNNLGVALAEEGNLPEATTQFREALRLQPNYADAHHNLGTALKKQGYPQEAAEHFKTAGE